MKGLVVLVFGLTCLVDLLLVLGTNRSTGHPPGLKRAVIASLISGAFAAGCLIPSLSFLGKELWKIVAFGVFIVIAFGLDGSTLRRGMTWLLLKFALHGAAVTFESGTMSSVMLVAGAIGILYAFGFSGTVTDGELIPVELNYGDRQWQLTALRDTGNTLRDPITGERVLVAGADMGQKLLGLTAVQLSAPAETLAAGLAPGMRLIPYRTVGHQGAMMLAMRLRDVKIGSWRGNALVAFAPEPFGKQDGYQMLVGAFL